MREAKVRLIAMICAALAGFYCMAAAAPASAQSLATLRQACLKANVHSDPHIVVDSCTRAIPSGALGTPQYVAFAYVQRGDFTIRDSGDYVRAIADYDRALAIVPYFGLAFARRGAAYLRQENAGRAVADLDSAIRLLRNLRDRAAAYNQRSQAHLALYDYPHAIADADRAAAYEPREAEYQKGRCWTRAVANRDLDAARAACDASLNLRPNDATTFGSRGLVGLEQQRWEDAWNDYDTALRESSNEARYYFGRGVAAMRLGLATAGQADIAHATQLNSSIAQTYAGYGIMP